ncbi:MAG: hypothetical protein ACM3X4_01750 [Ignavibacteriales bacterium]
MRRFDLHGKRLIVVALIAMLSVTIAAGVAWAAPPGALAKAEMTATVKEKAAEVSIKYTLKALDKFDTVPLQALAVAGTRIRDVKATTADGKDIALSLKDEPLKLSGSAKLPAAVEKGGDVTFVVKYVVDNSVTGSAERSVNFVPVLAVMWPPAAAAPGVFTGELVLPQGTKYIQGFPSVPKIIDTSGPTKISYDLQVLPSMLKAISTTGAMPLLDFDARIDLIIGVVVVAGAYAGYVAIRSNSKRAARVKE